MISNANLRLPMSTWEPLNLKNCEINGPLPIYRKLPILKYFTRLLENGMIHIQIVLIIYTFYIEIIYYISFTYCMNFAIL